MTYKALAVTVSTRAAAGTYADLSGPALVNELQLLGFETVGPRVVADGDAVKQALQEAIAEGFDLIVTTGGTGITPSDLTPEATLPLLSKVIPGIPESLRASAIAQGVPTGMLSRGVAGVAGKSLVINLPGSPKAIAESFTVLKPVLKHALEQIHGSDHS